MQAYVGATEGLRHRENITVAADAIEKAAKKKLASIAQKVCISGFRKGKAPLNIIMRHYGTYVYQDVLKDLIHRNFIDVIVREKINIVGHPHYTLSEYKRGKDFNCTVEFEVYPEIKLEGLSGIKIEKPHVEIKEADIDKILKILQEQQADWQEISDISTIEDRMTLDFSGTIDGQLFDGFQATDFVLMLGQNQIISGFEEGVLGRKKGEKFSFSMTFPQNYHEKEQLKSKTVNFVVEIKKIERRKLPELNKAIIKCFGVSDGRLTSLRAEVRKNMERELKNAIRNYLKIQIIESVLSTNNIHVPTVLVSNEMSALKIQMMQRVGNNERTKKELPCELFKEKATRRVKTSLIFGEIIRKNKLKVDKDYISSLIEEIAAAYEDPKEIIACYRKNKKLMKHVHDVALEEQAIKLLLASACITEKKLGFHEFMKERHIPGHFWSLKST